MRFIHTPAPATRMPLQGRRERPNCCACFDCSGSKGFSRSREKREWRRGIIVSNGRVRP